jgi:superfamily II DNA or RNA helicase
MPARVAKKKKSTVRFARKLVLNQWMLSLFNVTSFEELAEPLRNEALEGLDENNVHHFHHALTAQFFNLTQLPPDLLLEYDQNIVTHTQRLNDRRVRLGDSPVVWKYFQYLTLLFTEIYLDRYFTDAPSLLTVINEQVATYNGTVSAADQISAFDMDAEAWPQLNKVGYWSATGSGKTHIMHANILQYRHYLEKHHRSRELNRIILLTPNENLSLQHLDEFLKAGIHAELFDKEGPGLFAGEAVEILDIHKLKDEMGDKTIAVEAFEGNNLVLIDEGHRGASSGVEGAWLRFRNALCENGFSFEYSATFGQAIKQSPELIDLYAKSIVFDYSYRHFYGDGFGKDYQILNLDKQTQESHLELYLVASLLSFFQQQRLYQEQGASFRPFNIDTPLWVFVGSKVVKTLAAKDASDIIEILRFLARYLEDRSGSVERIERVLNQGLVTARGENLFAGRFSYLNTTGLSPAEVFDETLSALFNAAGGGSLYVENLKGATGEIALRVGDNDPFGVINVGDDTKLCKLCEDWPELNVVEREFSSSLFHDINTRRSTVNLLIGSKKFTEGWNSPRVSTMGLMNVGATEGSQIIQLFGRGVRLQGYENRLKRSGRVQLPDGLERPKHIGFLETLGIFGIHADYMAQFRDFLEDEGLPKNDERIEIMIPVIKHLGRVPLKMVRLQKTINGMSTEFGDAFRRLAPVPTLTKPDPASDAVTQYLQKNQVVLNWYPKIQALKSGGLVGGAGESARNETHMRAGHMAFLDLERLYFELERFKAERGWYNLNLSRAAIASLLADQSWYRLQIPADELAFDSFEKVRLWEDIAIALLKKYTERYYTFRKREWELPHLEYQELNLTDPNFVGAGGVDDEYYRILIDESQGEVVAKLSELKAYIEAGDLKQWEFRGMKAVWFGQHLYQPLLYVEKKVVDISPVPLNKGEWQFVEDLKAFHDSSNGFFAEKELYLLRNLSRGRGVGFFEAGNFHPDFILWLVIGSEQRVIFIDPKGIRNLGSSDPKIQFYETVKEIEKRLGDPTVRLHSFIVSNTSSATMELQWSMTKAEMEARNILFAEEDRETYIGVLLSSVAESAATSET